MSKADDKIVRQGKDSEVDPGAVRLNTYLWVKADGEGGVDFFMDAACDREAELTGIHVSWWEAIDRLRSPDKDGGQ